MYQPLEDCLGVELRPPVKDGSWPFGAGSAMIHLDLTRLISQPRPELPLRCIRASEHDGPP